MKNSIDFAVARSLADDASINYSNLSSVLGPGAFQPLEVPNKGGELGELLVTAERNARPAETVSPKLASGRFVVANLVMFSCLSPPCRGPGSMMEGQPQ